MKKLILIATVFVICSCSSTPREQPFTVDLYSSRYEAESINVYLKNSVSVSGGLRQTDIAVFYYPVEDAVCLRFRTPVFSDCRQFWNRKGRDAFVSAFNTYKDEYEQRQLTVKQNNKTREAYGAVLGYYVWQRVKITVRAYCSPQVKLGYQFNDRSVFFTTTQMEARYKDPITDTRDQSSPVTVMYFTRAQAESLCAIFNQEYLWGLGDGEAETDDYLSNEPDGYR